MFSMFKRIFKRTTIKDSVTSDAFKTAVFPARNTGLHPAAFFGAIAVSFVITEINDATFFNHQEWVIPTTSILFSVSITALIYAKVRDKKSTAKNGA